MSEISKYNDIKECSVQEEKGVPKAEDTGFKNVQFMDKQDWETVFDNISDVFGPNDI